jgi:hypothetical protein
MATVPVRIVGASDPQLVQRVVNTFAQCHTLARLMRWASAQTPPVRVAEIVTQDEYTHDVVMPFGQAFLSFDTT